MYTYSAIVKPIIIFLFIILSCVILYYGRGFLIPLAFGAVFALLVNPIDEKLRTWGMNKYLTAILSILLILLFFVILLSVFGWQIQQLSEQSEQIKKELIEKQKMLQQFVRQQFGIRPAQQDEYAENVVANLQSNISSFIGSTAGILANFFLSLIYAIMLLGEKTRIQKFFHKIIKSDEKAEDTIDETSSVIQNYLVGKLIIIAILSVAYSLGFLLAGIKYAVLIAVLAAFLSFIPYAGNIVGGLLGALITLATGGSMTDILILFGVIAVAQIVESYILSPWIVGGNVNLNPLFSIIAVVAMSIIWGAAGAIIALPLVGVLKVIFSHFETYRPVAFLMGDDSLKEAG